MDPLTAGVQVPCAGGPCVDGTGHQLLKNAQNLSNDELCVKGRPWLHVNVCKIPTAVQFVKTDNFMYPTCLHSLAS